MDIRFLTTFLEVAETRHFGRAAENLYLTQSAVSARIKLLEEYFNTALFIRNRNSIQITPAGEKLIPYAQELSNTLSKARKLLAQEECQHISCASTQNAFLLCFSNWLPNLLTHFNSVSFQHEIATVEQITRQLHEHSIDVALTTSQVKSDDIDSTLLFEVLLCMYHSNSSHGEPGIEIHDINIEWSPSINDKLGKLHPELRKAKLRTSSIDVALTMADAEACRLILPIKSHAFLDTNLRRVLASFAPSQLTQEVKIPVYLNQLKNQKNRGVEDVIAYMQLKVG
ncbi:LysR family transcriptional regulator [Brumicola pallidula]|uniref:HTH-type transcriptional regulator hdfR n=1 Tax=Brumicola pallidula DSM 14239 = ACAM 615 TaxID=1121922 RepID=K6ZE61_9ALTE|nr:LysR family transcriptional regulator [Glaciecola pallidula]GAC28637.1 HTH-type transcriptional regulator hdfR [Glaciecola pallidula DSM 14239 = ACAM 615]